MLTLCGFPYIVIYMEHIISFHSYANARSFVAQNLISTNDDNVLEIGQGYIRVTDSFLNEADWSNSHHVHQINPAA